MSTDTPTATPTLEPHPFQAPVQQVLQRNLDWANTTQ